MKYIKNFNESIENKMNINEELKKEIMEYLDKTYTKSWYNEELSNRYSEYVSEDEIEEYDGDYEEAYKDLSGGVIEYYLIDLISKDIEEKFNIDSNSANNLSRINYEKNCTWGVI